MNFACHRRVLYYWSLIPIAASGSWKEHNLIFLVVLNVFYKSSAYVLFGIQLYYFYTTGANKVSR